MPSDTKQVSILHFNDVYNVESMDDVGGAARFVSALCSYDSLDPLVMFSGDVFSPSIISTVTKGKHLIDVLKACRIDAACFGNHDFDFGVDNLLQCSEAVGCPWLLSNIVDAETGLPLAKAGITHCIQHEHSGLRIGIVGLVELEWVDTLSAVDADEIRYFDFCDRGYQLAEKLRSEDNCDLVIALTHMRWPNDRRLARSNANIDIILGGHDHNYGIEFVNNRAIVKSGTDFRQFSVVTLTLTAGQPLEVKIETVDVTASRFPEPDAGVAASVQEIVQKMKKSSSRKLGQLECQLEGRFARIRTRETNLGNFFCDIVLTVINADFVLVNSGSFRSDSVIAAGDFFVGDLQRILPMLDPLVLVGIDAATVVKVLENGVSQWPALEGRFPQVAGISFEFDGSKPSGSRVNADSIKINGQPLQPNTCYRMATKYYLYCGKDGYDMLPDCELLVDDEDGPIWSVSVQNYFTASAVLRGWQQQLGGRHRHRLIPMQRRRELTGQVSVCQCSDDACGRQHDDAADDAAAPAAPVTASNRWELVRSKFMTEESKFAKHCPKVEGRIVETSRRSRSHSSSSSSSSLSDS